MRPRSAPIFTDAAFKANGPEGRPGLRISDAISSLPRLHIQQLHTRLPVFREISLSPEAGYDATDLSSQVPLVAFYLFLEINLQHLQLADDDGHRSSSLLGMNWVAVNVQLANEEHRLSKPEYVHVWVSPGLWFNMPQVCDGVCLCLCLWMCLCVFLCACLLDRLSCFCICAPYSPLSRSFRTLQAAISLEEDGTNVVSSTLADELLGAPFASMAPRSSGAHVGR